MALLIIFGIQVLIHLLGFKLVQPVTTTYAVIWYSIMYLYILTGLLYALRGIYWWVSGMIIVLISQMLVMNFWEGAWFVTIGNALVLMAVVHGYATWSFKLPFKRDVTEGMHRVRIIRSDLLTETDLHGLPDPVQKYLRYTGVVNKPKVHDVRILFKAAMRNKGKDWFGMTSVQYNFFDRSERLFFLNAFIRGLPASGYHRYKNGRASMVVKLLSLFPVVEAEGEALFMAETVTAFNDMCVFAPATLIDQRIRWEALDGNRVKAIFSNPGVSISAILRFNDAGQLVNFITDDRFDIMTGKKYRFSTPVDDYRDINGYRLCHYGEAIWHYPEGDFTYGRFTLKGIQYNVSGS